MRAAKLMELNRLEIVDVPVPGIKNETDVQVQVKAVGVCGTDLHMFREERADVQLPRIMGHELSGIVTGIGSGVSIVKVGDHVVLDPVFACGNCSTCRKGFLNVCDTVRCFGVQMDGGYQDYIVVGEEHLYPYHPSVSFEEAALAEPFSIALNILDRTMATDQDNVLIIGSGTIGLSLLQAAKVVGSRVMIADVVPHKLAIAADMGADATVNSAAESLADAAKAFSADGFDIVIDAVGITHLFQQSLDYAAPRARVACIGFDAQAAEIPPVRITKKELSIIGSRMNCNKFPDVVKWLNGGNIQAQKMIARKYNIEDIQKAFEETLADSIGSIKTIILFN